MPTKSKPVPTIDPAPRPTIVLSQAEWRSGLEEELVSAGIGRDQADLMARAVIDRLVERLGAPSPSDPADEAPADYYDGRHAPR